MRSIVVATLWMIAGFGFTEFMADFLQIWRTRQSPMAAEAAEPLASATPTIHFADPALNYRPAPKPAPKPVPRPNAWQQ